MTSTFRSLASVNYRIWFIGALISNVGVWMQRTAQDWLVLTQLTDRDAAAVGIVTAIQFAPMLLLMPLTGFVADRVDRRRLLMTTQLAMGGAGLVLGMLTLLGWAEFWHVAALALVLGVAAAFDAPARQIFVADLVESRYLQNAVALNSATFNAARLFGPAVAGALAVAASTGWVFIVNAVIFGVTAAVLAAIDRKRLNPSPHAPRQKGELFEGFRYIVGRPDIVIILVVVFLIGTLGLNFPIYTSTMASIEFGRGAAEFGVLSSMLAAGSVTGALLIARRDEPQLAMVVLGALAFGVLCLGSSLLPGFWFFAVSLIAIGISVQIILASANALVQMTTVDVMRGRVMSVYVAISTGGSLVGAPVIGWVVNEFGPRVALAVGGSSGLIGFAIGAAWLLVSRRLTPLPRVTTNGEC